MKSESPENLYYTFTAANRFIISRLAEASLDRILKEQRSDVDHVRVSVEDDQEHEEDEGH